MLADDRTPPDGRGAPALVVISGLPGTGKTTLAYALARRLGAVHLSVDVMEDALLGAGLDRGWTTGVAAYEATRTAATRVLAAGRGAVVDAVNDSEPARDTWRRAAAETGSELWFVLLEPPSPAEHERRLAARERGLEHVAEPTWEQVRARAERYEPWPDEPLVVSADEPVEALVAELERRLEGAGGRHDP